MANRKSRSDRNGKYVLKKKGSFSKMTARGFVGLVAFVAAIYCIISIAQDKSEIAEQQAILDGLYAEAEALRAENTSYESIINEDDERAYMERIAIEVLGYAYPSERRFYDTTRS